MIAHTAKSLYRASIHNAYSRRQRLLIMENITYSEASTSLSARKRRRAITDAEKRRFEIGGLLQPPSRKAIKVFEHGSSKRIFTPYLNPPSLRYYLIDINALIS